MSEVEAVNDFGLLYMFCPDPNDQHFGCFADAIAVMEEFDKDVAKNIQALIKDIDFNDQNYGFELLKRSLAINKAVALWWD